MSPATTLPEAMRNALSIDVEEYFQVGAFEKILDRADWERHESRVEQSTDRILALLADRGVHATFSFSAGSPNAIRR